MRGYMLKESRGVNMKLGKHCAVNSRTGLPATDEERVKNAISLLRKAGIVEVMEILGSGHESVVLTDRIRVYKVFDRPLEYYSHLMKQLVGRFDKCKHFISQLKYFKIDEQTVLFYDYVSGNPYTGNRRSEMQEFLTEAALCGIVVKDVKPENFRIINDTLKFIDYGWDIVPFNYKDFVFMAQRAYLCLNGWANPQFKMIAKKAINTWDLPQLEGFQDFFNETYSQILNSKVMFHYDLLEVPENLWIDNILNDFFKTKNKVIFDDRQEFKIKGSHNFSNNSLIGDETAIIFGSLFNESVIQNLRVKMKEKQRLGIIFPNPFFNTTNYVSFDSIIGFFEKNGLKVLNTYHSPPRPDKNATFFSRFMFFETEAFNPCGGDTSLLIKACYQDGDVLETLVTHIVTQL
jgi:hypothetical protein